VKPGSMKMKTTSTDELAKILWNYNNLKQELVIGVNP